MDGLSVEVKLCRGDCSLVVSSDKFASLSHSLLSKPALV
jgi:hypothetical protein